MKLMDNIRTYVWLEALIWLVVFCIGVFGIKFYMYKNHSSHKTYQIFMQDVDGLIVGSTVKYMGVPVGHIQKIKIISDNIYVNFVLSEEGMTLPKGTIATVEFNGLGGSKSLELYPPTIESKSNNNLFYIKDTTRISDSMWLMSEMFDKMDSISVRFSSFAKDINSIIPKEIQRVDIEKVEKQLLNIDNKLEEYNKENNDYRKIKELTNE